MKLIILAAGQGYQLDGFNKLLIRDPADGLTIMQKYAKAFSNMEITIVVGYRAINVMQHYPKYNYVYNQDWAVTNNSYSLSLALTEEPCYVISGDLIIEPDLIEFLENSGPNIALTKIRENRTMGAFNVSVDKRGNIQKLYKGKLIKHSDPESLGIFKISSSKLLKTWLHNCRKNASLFVGQNLPYDLKEPVQAVHIGNHRFHEINTPLDYIRLLDGDI